MDGNFGPTEQILWPISVFSGIIMCKIVYKITCQFSLRYFKAYNRLSKLQKVEWNNRGFSTIHAVLAATVSFYLVVISDLFRDGPHEELMINRKSVLSDTLFGISIGYFLSDLAMLLWFFPYLGGKEYVLHHGLSMYSILLSLISGKAHVYILMVLFSEATTPFVNLRWYLDIAGQKSSNLYIYNGVALFLGWLVARILLFIYFFTHMYLHFDQVKTIFPLGRYSLVTVPPMLALMNVFWFWKIFRGMMKTFSKMSHTQ
ncbi:TLC domain-containing protein 4-like [Phoenix dactylifera]|uniref:TLC domain-containing protein 4-like n=1 Tax=Phoenix dactylifera TaxID=42345 RepID=A0A8B7CR43_PHODC|nr:TLC domain-containing protein 4-like [Phoenix dactylifera]XP_008804657.2 TLC domain-containing protein 4-like [Phoenix dactylifera]XP_008804658.2 TLC domain-containing protein 4-like [Phoenix dactylifera]